MNYVILIPGFRTEQEAQAVANRIARETNWVGLVKEVHDGGITPDSEYVVRVEKI